MRESASSAIRFIGLSGFVLFLLELVFVGFAVVVAWTAGPGGHPPAAAMIAIIVLMGLAVAAPLGLVLGLVGLITQPAPVRTIVGIVGNAMLCGLALWVYLSFH